MTPNGTPGADALLARLMGESDPLQRSAMIDMARYQNLLGPAQGAELSRHATGEIAGQDLAGLPVVGPALGGLAGGAAGAFLEGGKILGAAAPELSRGTMWEHDATSSPIDLTEALKRVYQSIRGGAGLPYDGGGGSQPTLRVASR